VSEQLRPTTEAELDEALLTLTPDELEADICKESFFELFCAFWHTIEAVELKLNWHIEYLCNQLQEVYETWAAVKPQPDVLINVPPGTSKSTTVTQLFPAWLWVKKPSIRLISSSFNAGLSISHSTKTRLCLKSSKFQRLFPGLGELTKDKQTGIVGNQVRPAYLKEEYIDGLLDPVRRPRPVLQDLKIALGSYAYAGQV
jgi:hypothetical protein